MHTFDASTKVVHGASIAHIGSGATMAATSICAASISTALTSTNLLSYQRCDLVLTYVPASTTSSTAMTIPVYRRDLDVGGLTTADDAAPAVLNSNKFVGLFQIPSSLSTGTYTMTLIDIPLPGGNAGCEFWLQNSFSTNLENAGWALTVIPKTDVGATT